MTIDNATNTREEGPGDRYVSWVVGTAGVIGLVLIILAMTQ